MNKSIFANNLYFIMKKLEFRDKSKFSQFLNIPVTTVKRWMSSDINPSINQKHRDQIFLKLGINAEILLSKHLEHDFELYVNIEQSGEIVLEFKNKKIDDELKIYIDLLLILKNNNRLKSISASEFVKFMSKD